MLKNMQRKGISRILNYNITNGSCSKARPIVVLSVFYCLAPHSGQNFDPAGISLPQFVQKAADCLAPHSGQDFEPAGIAAPQAEQVAEA